MKHTKKIVALGLSTLLAAGLAACTPAGPNGGAEQPPAPNTSGIALPQAIQDSGVLRIGGPVGSPPYVFQGDDGNVTGLAFDIMTEMANELGLEVDWVDLPYASAVTALKSDRIDLFTSSFVDTPERQEEVDFVDYYFLDMAMVVPAGNPKSIGKMSDLCGLVVAAASGSWTVGAIPEVSENCTAAGKAAIELREFPDNASVNREVETSRADVLFTTMAAAKWLESTDANFEVAGDYVSRSYAGLAVDKGNSELADALLAGLANIMENQKYSEVLKKWNSESISMDAPLKNGATTAPLSEEESSGR